MKTLCKLFIVFLVLLDSSCGIRRPYSSQQGYGNYQQQGYENNRQVYGNNRQVYGNNQQGYGNNQQVGYQVFYDDLSPYGQWTNYQNYGYVWIPDAGRDFFPYSTNGHWVMTEYGWTWASDYAWGWAPFHYGRWDYDNYYGWFWVPDNEWGPSWVNWRRANGYYGWSPMRPGVTVSLSMTGRYRDVDRWIFVQERDFGRSDIQNRYINRRDNEMIFQNSTVINNTYIDNRRNVTYSSGPRGDEVQKATGRRINNVTIRDSDRPGERMSNSQLQIYRPQVERVTDQRQQAAPSNVTDIKNVRPVSERNATYQRNRTAPLENNRRVERQVQPRRQTDMNQEGQTQQRQPQNQRVIRRQTQQQKEDQLIKQSDEEKTETVVPSVRRR